VTATRREQRSRANEASCSGVDSRRPAERRPTAHTSPQGFERAEREVVRVEYPKGLLFSLAVNGAAADSREMSVLDGTGARSGIEPQDTAP